MTLDGALADETQLGCGLLLSSDEHLRGVDHEHLTLVLHPFELVPPVIVGGGANMLLARRFENVWSFGVADIKRATGY